MSKRTRKTYTNEFRKGAVDLLRASNQPLSQVARELGVSVASLRTWKNQFPGASAKELWDENQKLKRENTYLRR
ncbi:transposase, partial [bacterium]|nr:transposase [bacterium]